MSVCPTCGAPWAIESKRVAAHDGRLTEWTLQCEQGHVFPVKAKLSGYLPLGDHPTVPHIEVAAALDYSVYEPGLVRQPGTLDNVRETNDPCAGCGGEVQPGQLYSPAGPRHLGC